MASPITVTSWAGGTVFRSSSRAAPEGILGGGLGVVISSEKLFTVPTPILAVVAYGDQGSAWLMLMLSRLQTVHPVRALVGAASANFMGRPSLQVYGGWRLRPEPEPGREA